MPAEFRVVGQKFLSKLNNGDVYSLKPLDFATHLKGGVLEEIKAIFNVQIQWWVALSEYRYIYDTGNDRLTIQHDGIDFAANGFSIGDKVKFSISSSQITPTKVQVECIVTSLSVGEILFNNIVVTQGSSLESGTHLIEAQKDDYLTGITEKTALKFDFGLIENDEPINFISKLTNTTQTYLYEEINHLTPNVFVQGKTQGNNKAAYTGSSQVAFVGLSIDKDYIYNENTVQEFQIEHTFKINPVYRDGEIDSLKGEDKPPLDIYNGDASLKYVFQSEFRTVLNNPNTSMISSYDTQLGSVGYLDEAYNGYESNYYTEDLVYTVNGNAVDRLEIGSLTNVNFKIRSKTNSFTADTPVIVGHTAIVDSLSYSFNSNEYDDVWTNENLRVVTGDAPKTDILLKNYTARIQGNNQIEINFDVEFNASQVALLEDKQDYLLYYTIQAPLRTVDTGDKVTGRIDVNYYFKNTDVAGLFDFDKFEQYPHPLEFDEGVSEGFTNAKTFNESGMMADGRFWILNTANLNSLNFAIAVEKFDDLTRTDLRNLSIDLSDQVTVNGVQQIELDSTRGYVLIEDDIFNYLKITTDNNDGTKQYYNIQVGYRMPWQSWLELKDAPSDFYDKTKSFNGLNQKSSNYSLNPNALGYGIKVLFEALVDSTIYVKTSEEIKVYDYDEDDQEPTAFTCEIETYNEDGTPIANNIIKQEFTEVRATFTPLVPPVFTEPVDMTEVANFWLRFAHGNLYTQRQTTWANDQANDTDTFIVNLTSPAQFLGTKTDPRLYSSTPTSITSTGNTDAHNGCASLIKYENYSITGTMFSTDSDNDCIIYNIAFMTDEFGVEHTLSLVTTAGGVSPLPNPLVSPTVNIFDFINTDAKCSLIYDFGKTTWQLIDTFLVTGSSGETWATVGDCDFAVNRSFDDITITITNWLVNGTPYSSTKEYNLNDNDYTKKFLGFQSIGFAWSSQPFGGFQNVSLTAPQNEYYVEMRVEPKESQSDFTDNRISSFIEAPLGTLLKAIPNTIIDGSNKAVLQYDGTNFIAQCLVETSQIQVGQDYDLSAELRPLDLEE